MEHSVFHYNCHIIAAIALPWFKYGYFSIIQRLIVSYRLSLDISSYPVILRNLSWHSCVTVVPYVIHLSHTYFRYKFCFNLRKMVMSAERNRLELITRQVSDAVMVSRLRYYRLGLYPKRWNTVQAYWAQVKEFLSCIIINTVIHRQQNFKYPLNDTFKDAVGMAHYQLRPNLDGVIRLKLTMAFNKSCSPDHISIIRTRNF